MSDPNLQLLQQFGEVQGQLKLLALMIQSGQESTNKRIDDFRQSIEGRLNTVETRIDGVEARIETIAANERGTALRGAGGGAVSAAIVAGAIEALKLIVHR
jgi:hypothetical protein